MISIYDNTYHLGKRETGLSLSKLNTDSGKRFCFKYNGVVAWNNLAYDAKVAESVSSFERTINWINTQN